MNRIKLFAATLFASGAAVANSPVVASANGVTDVGGSITTVLKNPAIKPIVDKVGPIVGSFFWIGVLVAAVYFIFKEVFAIIKYFQTDDSNAKDKKDAKDAMMQNAKGIVVVFSVGVILVMLLNIMGLQDVLTQFFTASSKF